MKYSLGVLIMIVILSIFLALILLFIYSACVVSSRCAREEEKLENYENKL